MRKISGFTLVEVLVAVALTGIILLTGYSTFQKIMEAQSRLGAAIDVQKNLFYTNEKLAALIREGGTIDYEEYFNRRMLGYTRGKPDFNDDGTPDNLFTFTAASHFGNGNNSTGKQNINYCGYNLLTPAIEAETCLTNTGGSTPTGYTNIDKEASSFAAAFPTGHQPYRQYEELAYNYRDPVGFPMPIKLPPVLTSVNIQIASRNATTGTVALGASKITDVGLPELYLIKKNLDNSYTRTYFRHVYVQDPFTVATITCDPTRNSSLPSPNINGCLGKIQMTKLEACDTFPDDGIIEAWIPHVDFRIGNVACPGADADIYKSAHEETIVTGTIPPNLTWVDVTAPEMNVVRATFLPNPLKIPAYMSGAGDPAESPSVSVYLEVELSTKLRNKSFVRPEMNYPRTLITTYDLSE